MRVCAEYDLGRFHPMSDGVQCGLNLRFHSSLDDSGIDHAQCLIMFQFCTKLPVLKNSLNIGHEYQFHRLKGDRNVRSCGIGIDVVTGAILSQPDG